MLILNLGAGKKLIDGAVNVDIGLYPGVDQQVDLTQYPWPWDSNSVDGIHASHIIEHFESQVKFLDECYRILRPDGFLRIAAPHASCVSSVGCMGHYRTYSYNTFHEYLGEELYMFGKAPFETEYQKLRWWYEEVDAEGNLPKWTYFWIKGVDILMNMLISWNPQLFENTLCSFIQCREVIWQGRKR